MDCRWGLERRNRRRSGGGVAGWVGRGEERTERGEVEGGMVRRGRAGRAVEDGRQQAGGEGKGERERGQEGGDVTESERRGRSWEEREAAGEK